MRFSIPSTCARDVPFAFKPRLRVLGFVARGLVISGDVRKVRVAGIAGASGACRARSFFRVRGATELESNSSVMPLNPCRHAARRSAVRSSTLVRAGIDNFS